MNELPLEILCKIATYIEDPDEIKEKFGVDIHKLIVRQRLTKHLSARLNPIYNLFVMLYNGGKSFCIVRIGSTRNQQQASDVVHALNNAKYTQYKIHIIDLWTSPFLNYHFGFPDDPKRSGCFCECYGSVCDQCWLIVDYCDLSEELKIDPPPYALGIYKFKADYRHYIGMSYIYQPTRGALKKLLKKYDIAIIP